MPNSVGFLTFTATVTQDNSAAVALAIQRSLGAAVEVAAQDIEREAKANAPVRSGALRDSIQAEPTDDELVWIVRAAAAYSLYVEMGTGRQASQPFLLPALEVVRQQFLYACRQVTGGV
jgi:HK97 gp10 family phage protein